MGDYFSAWRALEEAYEAGILKAIGVSNFYAHVLANFCETVRIKPMVNQVELHPYFAQARGAGNHEALSRSAGGLGAVRRRQT